MSRSTVAFAILAVCGMAALFALRSRSLTESLKHRIDSMHPSSVSSEMSAGNRTDPSTSPALSKAMSVTPKGTAAAGVPIFAQTSNAAQHRAAETDPQFVAVVGALRDYRAATGQGPVGNNSEITKALLGANTHGVHFSMSDMKMDEDGQLLDRWGHPYFFHQISKIEMQLRSAGPDGVMWTADDEVSP